MSDEVLNEKNAALILRTLYELNEPVFVSTLQKVVKNYHVLKNTISKLIDSGFVYGEEIEIKGRKALKVSLTEKGRAVAEKLKEAEEIAKMTPEELEEQRKRIHWIIDINTYVDHITAYDIHEGKRETFNIWLKPNGKYLLLFCDKCHSYDCYHVDWAVHDPVIGSQLKEVAEKKGLKIKYLEDEKKGE